MFFQLISRNGTYKTTFWVNIWKLWRIKCDVTWGWEISTWRTEHSNNLPKSHYSCDTFGCTSSCKNILGLSFHMIPAVNAQSKWFWQRWIQSGNRVVPLPKDENLFVCSNHFGKKKCFKRDIKVRNIVFVSLVRPFLVNL